MVTPCIVFDELSDLRARLNLRTGYLFDQHTGAPPRELSHELHAGNDRIEIIAAHVIAVVEIAEVDSRGIARIARVQLHPAGRVVGVRLENDPSEMILMGASALRVGRPITREIAGDGEEVQIGVRLTVARSLDDRGDGSVEPFGAGQ